MEMATTCTDYEQQRNARIGENRKRMEALGLLDLSHSISPSPLLARKKPRAFTLSPKPPLNTARRRSSRLVGTAQPSYKEDSSVKETDAIANDRQIRPEIYTEEHEKLLGSCFLEWELFKDGFAGDGTRIYDPVRGKTCHQCRQKTLGLRTSCSQCQSLQGQFCGDCLYMRYGENIIEANKHMNWVCPGCRGICNCSICRLRKGWAPTGSMYRLASKLNYKSVAHYLVMTRRGSSDVKQEKELKHLVDEEDDDCTQEDLISSHPLMEEKVRRGSSDVKQEKELSNLVDEEAEDCTQENLISSQPLMQEKVRRGSSDVKQEKELINLVDEEAEDCTQEDLISSQPLMEKKVIRRSLRYSV